MTYGVMIGSVVFALLFLGFLSICILVAWHLRKNRHLLHLERIKALEVGQSPSFYPPDRVKERYGRNAFWIAFWVGAVVPMGAVIATAVTTSNLHMQNMTIVIVMWTCIVPICVAGVVSATILMVSARRVATESIPAIPRKPPESPGHC